LQSVRGRARPGWATWPLAEPPLLTCCEALTLGRWLSAAVGAAGRTLLPPLSRTTCRHLISSSRSEWYDRSSCGGGEARKPGSLASATGGTSETRPSWVPSAAAGVRSAAAGARERPHPHHDVDRGLRIGRWVGQPLGGRLLPALLEQPLEQQHGLGLVQVLCGTHEYLSTRMHIASVAVGCPWAVPSGRPNGRCPRTKSRDAHSASGRCFTWKASARPPSCSRSCWRIIFFDSPEGGLKRAVVSNRSGAHESKSAGKAPDCSRRRRAS
jgi:hypothetical protein